ncbi:MAG: hypothetical protein J6Q22_05030 [Prevotella sp.]|nr:hypothetical protein [Prevotella sp.]
MATTQQTQTTPTASQAANTTPSNDGVKSIADALAALPKENEQTMKEFLNQQAANAKNANDELVEQFGSAIDNSEFAASLNEVKDAFRKDADKVERDEENAKQREFLSNIQNDLDRILENQGDALRADVTRDDAVNDTALNEAERKDEEKVDEETDIVKEDVKPVEVKVDVELPQKEASDVADNDEPKEPSKEETLLSDIASAQTEQNTLLSDIGEKLSDIDVNEPATDEPKPDVPTKEETLLEDLASTQTEQNKLLTDIGEKLSEADASEPVTDEPKEPSKEEALLGDIAAAQSEQNTLLTDIGEKLTDSDKASVPEVTEGLGKINDSLDDILEQFGDSVANTDVNEPAPLNVQVEVENKQSEPVEVPEEKPDAPQSVELAEGSLNSLKELVDEVKQNENDLIEKLHDEGGTSTEENALLDKNSITELANDISGAADAMNNQDNSPLQIREDEKVSSAEREPNDRTADKSSNYYEDVNQVGETEEPSPLLDARMDMAARAERDVTPVLNDVQLFNRMSLSTEEIHVLASEIGKAVAENMKDPEGDRARDAAYIDEVERMVRG